MPLALAVTKLFWLAVLVLVTGLGRRLLLWRQGQAAPVEWSGLLQIPKRYFVDLHNVVARDPYIAKSHIAVAGGAVAILCLVAVNYGLQLYWRLFDWLIIAAAAVMLAGSIFIWLRRRDAPSRLSTGAWSRLPYSLAAFAIGIGLIVSMMPSTASSLIAIAALLLLVAGSAELALGIGLGGPMKHAVAGLLHLAFHPRPERFSGVRSTQLRALDLASKEHGVSKPEDFRWNQLLSFDACVQCGKCEAACPAFASGQPLNPKKLVQDLVAGFSGTNDATYAGSPHPGLETGAHSGSLTEPIVPSMIEPQTLWSCTTCRACVEECPMLIEHVDAIIDMRRNLNLVRGDALGKAAETLANLRETETQGGFRLSVRYNWASDLGVKSAEPGRRVDVLFVAGEGAFDMRYQRTLRALVKVLKAAKVDFAVLGELERDTGDTARRLGDEATFQTLARRNVETLKTLSFERIVTPDPHVFHSLKNEYPEFGGHYTVLHHTTFLAALVRDKKLVLQQTLEKRQLTYHDPCYLGRYNGEFDAPRDLLRGIGIDVREMQRSGPRARCCGGGGGAPLTDIPGRQRIPDIRVADSREVGAAVIAVACPQCTAMLEGVSGDGPEIIDIAELIAESLEQPQ
jgi:dimethylglycine catabolism B